MQFTFRVLVALAATSIANAAPVQTEADEYTRYELLAPETSSFKIYYEVTATAAGAEFFYNPIRKGSTASDEHVYDAMLGKPLHFEVVSGTEARKDPVMADADPATDYIKVTLARPVPENGQGRIVILKTYQDAKSYHLDGNALVFERPLGIKRNKVVLPAGYEVVGLTVPSQILTEKDGRLLVYCAAGGCDAAPGRLSNHERSRGTWCQFNLARPLTRTFRAGALSQPRRQAGAAAKPSPSPRRIASKRKPPRYCRRACSSVMPARRTSSISASPLPRARRPAHIPPSRRAAAW